MVAMRTMRERRTHLRAPRTWAALAALAMLAAAGGVAGCAAEPKAPVEAGDATTDHAASAALGKTLYETGCGLSGDHVTCTQGPAWFAEADFGCAACHGFDGAGGRFEARARAAGIVFVHTTGKEAAPSVPDPHEADEGTESATPKEPVLLEAPDIRLSTLRAPYHGMDPDTGAVEMPDAANGWTDEQIAAVIRDGARPDGSEPSELMPRWALDDGEMDALLVYMGGL
jgi:hypothetical protein